MLPRLSEPDLQESKQLPSSSFSSSAFSLPSTFKKNIFLSTWVTYLSHVFSLRKLCFSFSSKARRHGSIVDAPCQLNRPREGSDESLEEKRRSAVPEGLAFLGRWTALLFPPFLFFSSSDSDMKRFIFLKFLQGLILTIDEVGRGSGGGGGHFVWTSRR